MHQQRHGARHQQHLFGYQHRFSLNPAGWSVGSPVYTNVSGLSPSLNPSNPWQSASNPLSQASIYITNNQAWIGLPIYPGTYAGYVTNYIQLLAYNGNNASTANWTTNNIAIVVAPPLPTPPALEVRFDNSSTNADTDVYILPSSTDAPGSFGNGFWWSNANATNNWTNWITNGYATVRLSDIGVSGTNAQGRPYYSIYTTNFPNAAWYLSYGGGPLTNNTTPPAPQSGQPWYGYEWAPFEVTLDGNPSDKCDTTYINQFSIPMTVRALTNDYASSAANIYPSNSLAYYQICGFTNWTSTSAVAITLSNLAAQLSANFPNAAITNANGQVVMYAGPSSAGMGSLQGPASTPAFPNFAAYFAAVQANGSRTNKIKDSIGLSGATNTAGLGTNPIFMFSYDFDLVVTTNNTLLLTNGTINVANQPGSTGTNLAVTNYGGLWMEIGADAGPQDSWASSAVYLAPTPANYVQNYQQTNVGMQTYTATAPTNLAGTPVFQSSTNAWLNLATNTATVCGTNRTVMTNPTAYDLYESQFGTAVMGRILGDMAAGFALGFINSGTTNPAMGFAYGDSPSGSWWGGNEYPLADTVNSIAYSDVNTNYSAWGGAIYSATKVTYGHPIYDRMQFYGGGNATNSLQIQPASSTNNQVSGAGGSVLLPVWVVEVEFFNGLSSVGSGGGGGGGGGSGFATWGGGSLPAVGTAAYSNALLQYAFGGSASYSASSAQTNFGTASLSNVSGLDYLILREIIRTNDANLNVWSEHTTNLTNTSWTSNSIPAAASADQSGATPGVNQVQEFRTPQGSDQRKFLRLKATYDTP